MTNQSKNQKVKKTTLGHFGKFGGRFVPEVLIPALDELEKTYNQAKRDKKFHAEFDNLLKNYTGRPTPLYFAENLTRELKGARIFIKREDLNHTGAHKILNCLGQALLAKQMGKKRVIAETGAGQHGVATATIAAKFGFQCTIYMGAVDIERQRPNVFWMEKLGAEVKAVTTGTKRLKDAVDEALRDWITNIHDTHYLLGSALGPHPFPTIVRDFASVIGQEVRQQIVAQAGRLPDYLIACVGGGSNAIGLFHPFLKDKKVKKIGVEAGGISLESGKNSARFSSKSGSVGISEGFKGYFLQDADGQILPTHSIAAGLDHPGVGPEHSYLFEKNSVEYTYALDKEVISALKTLIRTEGIIPALESAHAVAHAIKLAPKLSKQKIIIVNLSGRGDKDIFTIAEALGDEKWKDFLKSKIS